MREVEASVTVLLNPEDAATHATGVFGGYPIVADPDVPPGFARFRIEPPPGETLKPSQPLTVNAEDMRALGMGTPDA